MGRCRGDCRSPREPAGSWDGEIVVKPEPLREQSPHRIEIARATTAFLDELQETAAHATHKSTGSSWLGSSFPNSTGYVMIVPQWLQDRIRERAKKHGPRLFGGHTTKSLDVITELWRKETEYRMGRFDPVEGEADATSLPAHV